MEDVDMPAPPAPPPKGVSFPQPAPTTSPNSKLLARKPTPFNSELAAEIRKSGLAAFVKDNDDPSPAPTAPAAPAVPVVPPPAENAAPAETAAPAEPPPRLPTPMDGP